MTDLAHKLAGARQLLDPILGESRLAARTPLGHGVADAVLKGGLLRGTLHEIFAGDAGAAAAGFAAGLAQRLRGHKRVLWIRQDFAALEHAELCPTGLAELGIDPAALILLRAANAEDALRAGADALSCGALGAAIVEVSGHPRVLDLVASRRLVLGAQAKGVTALLLRRDAQAEPSAAETRWLIRSAPSVPGEDWSQPRFDAALTRNRHGETAHWVMEWCCDDGAFKAPADHGRVAAAAADRPLASGQSRRAA